MDGGPLSRWGQDSLFTALPRASEEPGLLKQGLFSVFQLFENKKNTKSRHRKVTIYSFTGNQRNRCSTFRVKRNQTIYWQEGLLVTFDGGYLRQEHLGAHLTGSPRCYRNGPQGSLRRETVHLMSRVLFPRAGHHGSLLEVGNSQQMSQSFPTFSPLPLSPYRTGKAREGVVTTAQHWREVGGH